MTANISPISLFDADRFPQELIPIVSGFLDGPATQISFERACKRFYQPSTKLYEAAETLIRHTSLHPGENADQMRRFYGLFKARVNELHIPPICRKMWWAVLQVNRVLIPSICKLDEFKEIQELQPRSCALKSQFKKCAVQDARDSYAKSDIHAINPFTIRKTQEFIRSLGESSAGLLPEIRKHHPKEEIEAARQKYLPLEANASRLKAFEERIKQELIQERAELKKALERLRGSPESAGAIEAAYRHLKQTEEAVEKKLSNYIAESQKKQSAELISGMKQNPPKIELTLQNMKALTDALVATFIELTYDKENARKAHLALVEELDYIAIFDNTGRIVSGRWVDIEQDMQPEAIAKAAQEEFEKIASFYGKLLTN